MQEDADVVVVIKLPGIIPVDEGGTVLVVDDQVEVAVIIEVAIGGAVGKRGLCKTPGQTFVGEGKFAIIAEGFVEHRIDRYFFQQLVDPFFFSCEHHFLQDIVRKKVHKIEIGDVFIDAVANINIGEAIVVHIEEEGAPAPVGGGHAAEIGDVKEFPAAIVELQAVFHVLVIKAGFQFGVIEVDIVKGAEGLEAIVVFGQHICSEYLR